MAIHIYNTLTRRKEEFKPVREDRVGFYVCGPTVYDYFHIGNARPFIVFDVIRRYMIYRGYNVRFAMNLTDIDDKIINRANELGVESREVAQKFSAAFFEDLQKLGVRPADFYPRATDHIEDMVALIQRLIDNGVAYESGGDVYFSVKKFPEYTKLSGKKLEDLRAGERVAIDERKQDAVDFTLWKAAKPGEPWWESPWGKGRPGWHLECSCMSMKYLGETFDIHAGGQDLIFPHHENEIAQSEGATGKPFANYWMHNGFLDLSGVKMSKSLGNFLTARAILEQFPAAAIRIFYLQKHYRSPIDFSDEPLQAAVASSGRIAGTYKKILATLEGADVSGDLDVDSLNGAQENYHQTVQKLHEELVAAMDDDFNTSAALGKFFDLLRETNKFIDSGLESKADFHLLDLARRNIEDYNEFWGIIDQGQSDADNARVDEAMQAILGLRQEMRKEKQFDVADRIRNVLTEAGVIVEDSPEGAKWRWR